MDESRFVTIFLVLSFSIYFLIYFWLTLAQDGGRWRVMFVCNGQSPCPTLYAEEGDLVELTVKSDIYAQSSIHWSVNNSQYTFR